MVDIETWRARIGLYNLWNPLTVWRWVKSVLPSLLITNVTPWRWSPLKCGVPGLRGMSLSIERGLVCTTSGSHSLSGGESRVSFLHYIQCITNVTTWRWSPSNCGGPWLACLLLFQNGRHGYVESQNQPVQSLLASLLTLWRHVNFVYYFSKMIDIATWRARIGLYNLRKPLTVWRCVCCSLLIT